VNLKDGGDGKKVDEKNVRQNLFCLTQAVHFKPAGKNLFWLLPTSQIALIFE
jgi:hypothetical protein